MSNVTLHIPIDKTVRAQLEAKAKRLGFDSAQAYIRVWAKAEAEGRNIDYGIDDWGEPSPAAVKRLNKAKAFRTYLDLLGVSRESVYVIGMGDAENDESIFAEADLSLGFSDAVRHMVNLDMPPGTSTVIEVFRAMQNQMPSYQN